MNKRDQKLLAEAYSKIYETNEGESLYDLFDWKRMRAMVSLEPLPRKEGSSSDIDVDKLKQTTPIKLTSKALNDGGFEVGEIYLKLSKDSPGNYDILKVSEITEEGPIFTNKAGNQVSVSAGLRVSDSDYLAGPFNLPETIRGFEKVLSSGKSQADTMSSHYKDKEEKFSRGEVSSVNYD